VAKFGVLNSKWALEDSKLFSFQIVCALDLVKRFRAWICIWMSRSSVDFVS
jgi:hypothetical protein